MRERVVVWGGVRLGERGGREKERGGGGGGGGGERAHNKGIMYNCFITSFKFIMFYYISVRETKEGAGE